MDGWYYSRNGQSVGPIPLAQLKQLAGSGEVAPEDPVWHPSLAGWTAARKVPGLIPLRGTRPAPVVANAPPRPVISGAGSVDLAPAAAGEIAPASTTAAGTSSALGKMPAAAFEPMLVQPGAGRASDGSSSAAAPPGAADDAEVSFRSIQTLHHSRIWLVIIALAMFALCIATLLTGIALVTGNPSAAQMLHPQPGIVTGGPTFGMVLCGTAYIIIGILAIALSVYLIRALLRIGELLLNRRTIDLEAALDAQLACWRFTAILMIASLLLAAVIALAI